MSKEYVSGEVVAGLCLRNVFFVFSLVPFQKADEDYLDLS